MKVIRNAVIMAAGTSSRFVPLSEECPKGLLEVKGEILIERLIRQLKAAGISDITVVVGYMAEKFDYLAEKFGVNIVFNGDYDKYNNTSSLIRVIDKLKNTYICSSDNYFPTNVFKEQPCGSYYSALYSDKETDEYCMTLDGDDNIISVSVGGKNAWYMVGHVYFSEDFSNAFKRLLSTEYEKDEVRQGYWEDLYVSHIDILPKMRIHRYNKHDIEEFDSIDELRMFDKSYINDTRSSIVRDLAARLSCMEADLSCFSKIMHEGDGVQFSFRKGGDTYLYNGLENIIEKQ